MHASTLLTSLFAASVLAGPVSRGLSSEIKKPRALYFITNGANNEVASLNLDSKGQISMGQLIATGGKGSVAFFGNNNTASEPDSLLSQSPVTIAGNMLFAVNSGSNDMTAFQINEANPKQLTKLGQPVKLPGTFPNTVSASTVNNIVCVGMSGSQAGMSCAKFNPAAAAQGNAAVGAFDALRKVDLGQSDPPVGPQNTMSDVLFVSDQDAVRMFVKGSGKKSSQGLANGFVEEFPVQNGSVAAVGKKTAGQPGALLFGSSDLPKRNGIERTLTSDASFGAHVFHYDESGGAHQDAAIDIGGGTPCWTTFSKFTQKGYVSSVDNNKIVEVDQDLGQISRTFANNDANPGFTDMTAAGTFVYALSPGKPAQGGKAEVKTAVAQVNVASKNIQEVKSFAITAAGVSAGKPAGMTAFF